MTGAKPDPETVKQHLERVGDEKQSSRIGTRTEFYVFVNTCVVTYSVATKQPAARESTHKQ